MGSELIIHDAFRDVLHGWQSRSDHALIEHCRIIIRNSPPSPDRDVLISCLNIENTEESASAVRLFLLLVDL